MHSDFLPVFFFNFYFLFIFLKFIFIFFFAPVANLSSVPAFPCSFPSLGVGTVQRSGGVSRRSPPVFPGWPAVARSQCG